MGKFLLSTLLLLTTAFASTAETVTFDFKNNTYDLGERGGSTYVADNAAATSGDVSLQFSKTSGNGFRLWSDGLRVYKTNTGNATIAVSAKNANITEIEMTVANKFTTVKINNTDLNYTSSNKVYSWSGKESNPNIIITQTSGNYAIITLKVTYEAIGSPELLPADIVFPQNAYTFSIGESFESPVATKATTAELVYSSDNEEVATVDASTGELTLKSEGTAVITAKAEENTEYNAGLASYTLTVIDPSIKIVLNAPFTDSIDNLTFEGEGADKIWTYGGATYGLKGTAHNVTDAPSTPCYAVTPVINLAGYSEIKTTFKQAANFFNNTSNFQTDCQIMIREVPTGEWTPIEMTGLPDGKSWTYVNSSIDLNTYAGKSIQIGFCYTNGQTGTWEIKDLLIKGKYTPVAPAVPEILINGKEVTDLNSTENGTVSFVVADGTEVYYKVTNTSEAMLTAEDDYTKYETPFQIQIGQSVSYYAQSISDPTLRSEVTKATATVPTGVAEIEAAGAGEVRWFDMQGREVKGQPEKGIYVRVANGKASKVIL